MIGSNFYFIMLIDTQIECDMSVLVLNGISELYEKKILKKRARKICIKRDMNDWLKHNINTKLKFHHWVLNNHPKWLWHYIYMEYKQNMTKIILSQYITSLLQWRSRTRSILVRSEKIKQQQQQRTDSLQDFLS